MVRYMLHSNIGKTLRTNIACARGTLLTARFPHYMARVLGLHASCDVLRMALYIQISGIVAWVQSYTIILSVI